MHTTLSAKRRLSLFAAVAATALFQAAQAFAGSQSVSTACGAGEAEHRWGQAHAIVEPSPFNGVHGLVIDRAGRLIATSFFGGQLWLVDRTTGAASVLVDRPDGQADDVAIGPNGEMAWTSLLEGKVRYREADDAPVRVIAVDLPFINSIRFDPRSGRLYAAQVYGGDALWELDPGGASAPRLIAENLGGLNGFDIAADGLIYGPLALRGEIASVNPENGEITVLGSGFSAPVSLKIDGAGDFWVVDEGRLVQVDRASGTRTVRARIDGILDNLAIGAAGEVYVSDGVRNAIHVYDPGRDTLRALLPPRVAVPAGLAIADDKLWVANGFVLRTIDLSSGEVAERYPQIQAPFPFTVSESNGRIAVSSTFLKAVAIFDATSGKALGTIDDASAPSDAIILDDGDLIYLDYDRGTLIRASGAGYADRTTIAQALDGPVQMALARDNRVYITTRSGAVVEAALTTGVVRPVISGLDAPEGLAETPWGTIVVAEVGTRSLLEIDPAAGTRSTIATDLPIGLTMNSFMPPYAIPTDLVIDADGTIYLSTDVDNAIYRFRVCRRGSGNSCGEPDIGR